ncbi:inositol monophosphatase [Candidatus Saccharibacteria bacterium]|nr:inositol monophosphatase [Candidatus Saccharibacteria bacterium]
MYDEYLKFSKGLAYEAGEVMKKYFKDELQVELKEDDTIVTVADKEINQLVINRIKSKYPDHAVCGEEQSHAIDSQYVWVCDPIDGTNPFAMELPISVFSLAIVVDGVPKAGVIYSPFVDKLYYAQEGRGAFVNNNKLSVNSVGFGKKARMNFDWWPEAEFDFLENLRDLALKENVYMLSPGSTTHAAALVASGEFVASVFPGTTGKNVDIAAAKIIVEEAGGKVTDFYGNEQRYDEDKINGAIVSNGIVHKKLVKALKGTEIKHEV